MTNEVRILDDTSLALEGKSIAEVLELSSGIFSKIPLLNKLEDLLFTNYKDNSKVDFVSKRLVKVPIPLGLTSTYLEYTKILNEGLVLSTQAYDNVLVPFARWLAVVINDIEVLSSNRVQGLTNFKPGDLKSVNDKLKRVVEKRPTTQERKFGDVVKRVQELDEIDSLLMSMDTLRSTINIDQVQKKVEEIDSLLNNIIEIVSEPHAEISKKHKQYLITINETAIKEITFMSNMIFNHLGLVRAYGETKKKVFK